MRTFLNTDDIRTERSIYRDNKTIFSLLGVILGELDRRPNPSIPVSVNDIYKVVKKLYDAAIECGNKEEEAYLKDFIRKQMTPEQIEMTVVGILEETDVTNVGGVMRVFAEEFPGQYDGKIVSTIAQKYLKK